MIQYISKSLPTKDLYLNQFGFEQCSPGHYFGPAIRDYYLIHYITKGKGSFRVGEHLYELKRGQGFLICPDAVTFYQADKKDPWHYYWVGFNGEKAAQFLKEANLSEENPILSYRKDGFFEEQFEKMCKVKNVDKNGELMGLGYLYILLSALIECNTKQDSLKTSGNKQKEYVKQVLDFICTNYASKITVTEIASVIGLNRSYLSSIFKETTQLSIQEYIVHYRISKAKELLDKKELSIGDISRSVGYTDPLLFSKIFKKVNGVSPLNYRKQQQKTR